MFLKNQTGLSMITRLYCHNLFPPLSVKSQGAYLIVLLWHIFDIESRTICHYVRVFVKAHGAH